MFCTYKYCPEGDFYAAHIETGDGNKLTMLVAGPPNVYEISVYRNDEYLSNSIKESQGYVNCSKEDFEKTALKSFKEIAGLARLIK